MNSRGLICEQVDFDDQKREGERKNVIGKVANFFRNFFRNFLQKFSQFFFSSFFSFFSFFFFNFFIFIFLFEENTMKSCDFFFFLFFSFFFARTFCSFCSFSFSLFSHLPPPSSLPFPLQSQPTGVFFFDFSSSFF